jgi:hypothetical protein
MKRIDANWEGMLLEENENVRSQKKSGMHCCIPDRFRFFVEPYLFFFLAFFFAAIRFSSHSIRNLASRSWRSA